MDVLEDYCAQDVKVTAKLYKHLVTELENKGFSKDSIELEHKVAAIIAKQVINGFRLDVVNATTLIADLQGQVDRIYQQFQDKWPPYEVQRISEKTGKTLKPLLVTFNPGSRQQIAEKLIELGWSPTQKTEKGSIIVDEAVLEKIDLPEAKLFLDYLLLQKRISQVKSWLDALGSDGRVHGKVITNGAITGRATHSSPNLAQIPNSGSLYGPECRDCWTVDEGKVMVGVDLSGIELRCFAHYLNDPEYTKAVIYGKQEEGTDVHTRNQKAFGVDTRNQAKTVLYAVLYGASPGKVGSIIGGSSSQGKKIIDSFERNVPAYAKLKQKVVKFAAKGWLPGLDGRKLLVRSEHSALNTLLQSAGAIIAKQWLVCFSEELKVRQVEYKLVAWVHDEVVIEARPEVAEIIREVVVQSATKAGEALNFRCRVDAEGHIGRTWKDVH
jgi:DNA polymerase I-like protein with 3'-5' exonuclease and polymerase domains